MKVKQTAEAISGGAKGVLFAVGFGSLWLCTGLLVMHWLNIVSGAVVAIIFAMLTIPAFRLLRLMARAPKNGINAEQERQIKRTFGLVNTIQWVAIVVAVVLFGVFHLGKFIVPAITAIVGLHLFPLARLFRYSAHYVTGALLILWSGGVVIMLHRRDIPSIGALGTGTILLLSAAYTLAVATRAAKYVLESRAKVTSVNR